MVKIEEIKNPWCENSYVCDRTFATRLLSFLMRNKDMMAGVHPMEEEEFEYLVRVASELKIWQMTTAVGYNKTYFENLLGSKVNPSYTKYLEAIHCKNAFDIEKYLNTDEPDNGTKTDVKMTNDKGIWVAVNKDGSFVMGQGKPMRTTKKIYIEDENTILEDHYGKEYHPDIWSGDYEYFWEFDSNSSYIENRGISCNKENLPEKFKDMTWDDEPRQL